MLYYTILYYAILYYTIPYYTILYYNTLHYDVMLEVSSLPPCRLTVFQNVKAFQCCIEACD